MITRLIRISNSSSIVVQSLFNSITELVKSKFINPINPIIKDLHLFLLNAPYSTSLNQS